MSERCRWQYLVDALDDSLGDNRNPNNPDGAFYTFQPQSPGKTRNKDTRDSF